MLHSLTVSGSLTRYKTKYFTKTKTEFPLLNQPDQICHSAAASGRGGWRILLAVENARKYREDVHHYRELRKCPHDGRSP